MPYLTKIVTFFPRCSTPEATHFIFQQTSQPGVTRSNMDLHHLDDWRCLRILLSRLVRIITQNLLSSRMSLFPLLQRLCFYPPYLCTTENILLLCTVSWSTRPCHKYHYKLSTYCMWCLPTPCSTWTRVLMTCPRIEVSVGSLFWKHNILLITAIAMKSVTVTHCFILK